MNPALGAAPARILETREAVTTRTWSRTAAVDFFRGLGLWMVFVDHMDPNLWSYLTLWRFGFSDFAEIFVYLSGFIGIGSYQRALNAGDAGAVLKKLGRRMGRLYVAHIISLALSGVLLYLFAKHGVRFSNDDEWYGWMREPVLFGLRALTLTYAPSVFSLIPLYIAISPVLLLAAIGLRRAPKLTFSISAALWVASQIPAFDSRLTLSAWVLHPVAWQFLFVLGAGTRYYSDHIGKFKISRVMIWAAAAIVAVSLVLKLLTYHRFAALLPPFLQGIPGLNVGKDHLAYYRMLHFWALALLVYAWTRRHPLRLQSWFARLVMACGVDSLVIYSSILVLDIGANLYLQATHGGTLMQTEFTVVGLALLSGVAWLRKGSRVRALT
ncbi:MAG: OpgC domain-containing protein, partial [Bryobacteraceae bacterium]